MADLEWEWFYLSQIVVVVVEVCHFDGCTRRSKFPSPWQRTPRSRTDKSSRERSVSIAGISKFGFLCFCYSNLFLVQSASSPRRNQLNQEKHDFLKKMESSSSLRAWAWLKNCDKARRQDAPDLKIVIRLLLLFSPWNNILKKIPRKIEIHLFTFDSTYSIFLFIRPLSNLCATIGAWDRMA